MNSDNPQPIVVTDIHMPFGSMIRFMVKWAIASIPALIILIVLSAACWSVMIGVFAALGNGTRHAVPSDTSANAVSEPIPGSADETAYIPKLLIRNVSVGKSVLGETGVFGEIKNSGDRSLKKVEITVLCLGADGNPVFEKTANPVLVTSLSLGDNEPLKPGYSRQFGVNLNDAPSDWTKKVSIRVSKVEFQ